MQAEGKTCTPPKVLWADRALEMPFNSGAVPPISELVTTQTHIPDWKVTTGYRVLLKVGWGVTVFAVYMAAVAVAFGSVTAWWIVAALAIAAMLVGLLLPEPVPREMLNGHRTMVDLKRSSSS